MSIQKKNGKYVPVIYMGKDQTSGKKIYKWGHYWERKKDAKKEEAEMIISKEAEMKTYKHKEITFEKLAEQWGTLIADQKYSPITRETQTYILKKHIIPIFGEIKVKEIEPIHIQKFINTKNKLAPETQRKILYLMKNILNSAVKWNMMIINPCSNIILPKITKKQKCPWNPIQIKTFLNWEGVKKSKYQVMLLIAFHTGMRPGEIVGLKWENIEKDEIHIKEGLDKKKRATGLKTSSSKRIIYINKKIEDALLEQRKWQMNNKIILGDKYKESNYIFTHESGSCITPQQLYINFQRLTKRCNEELNENLPIISLYNARHSFGTNAAEAGAEINALSRTMGHSTTKTTSLYVHPRDTAQKKVMNLISEIY